MLHYTRDIDSPEDVGQCEKVAISPKLASFGNVSSMLSQFQKNLTFVGDVDAVFDRSNLRYYMSTYGNHSVYFYQRNLQIKYITTVDEENKINYIDDYINGVREKEDFKDWDFMSTLCKEFIPPKYKKKHYDFLE